MEIMWKSGGKVSSFVKADRAGSSNRLKHNACGREECREQKSSNTQCSIYCISITGVPKSSHYKGPKGMSWHEETVLPPKRQTSSQMMS